MIFERRLENILVFLVALIPVLTYLGRSLFYIGAGIILIGGIFLICKRKILINSFYSFKIAFILISFYLSLLFINFFNPSAIYTKNISIVLMLSILFPLFYFFRLSKFKNENLDLFLKVVFLSISFISFIMILSFLTDIDIINTVYKSEVISYYPSLYHSKQTFLAICIGLILFYLRTNNSLLNKILFLFIVLACFASEGRTAILTLCFGIVIYYISNSYLQRQLKIKNIIYSILFLSIIIFLIVYLRSGDISNLDFNTFTSDRYDGWLLYVNLILDKNTLFGYGIFGGKILVEQGLIVFKHPHNIFVEILFTCGFIGFFILIILFIIYLKNIISLNSLIEVRSMIITTFFAVLISGQAFWSIWAKNHVIPIIIIVVVSLLFSPYKKDDNDYIEGDK